MLVKVVTGGSARGFRKWLLTQHDGCGEAIFRPLGMDDFGFETHKHSFSPGWLGSSADTFECGRRRRNGDEGAHNSGPDLPAVIGGVCGWFGEE